MVLTLPQRLVIAAFILPLIPSPAVSYENHDQFEVLPPPAPVLAPIPAYLQPVCSCESKGSPTAVAKQFNPDGSVVHGPGNNWGICQINATAHQARAKALGIDYMTREGNIAFAELLFSESGYRPWYKWSGHCWKDDPRIDQEALRGSL